MNKEKISLKLVHLYPKEMNIYGDRGNIIALTKRCDWRGIEIEVINAGLDKNEIPEGDIYFMGGGQDNDMYLVFEDLVKKKKNFIESEVNKNKVFLLICGGFQLFGKFFLDSSGRQIDGLGILSIETQAPGNQVKDRCLGNLLTQIDPDLLNQIGSAYEEVISPTLVGFENHSGQTFSTEEHFETLGRVVYGRGNNPKDLLEGFRYKNVFASYSHGPILPKNPHLADFLLYQAMQNKYGDKFEWLQLDDKIEWQAHLAIKDRLLK